MQYTIFDIETNGLLDNVSKIHCLSYQKFEDGTLTEKNSITNYEEIKNFIQTQSILIGHNIIRYDLPVLKKLLGVIVPKETKIIDTLGLSWYLYSSYDIPRKGKKVSHGLDVWGEILGVEKPKINDWSNLSTEEYIHRCNEDVEINQLLFHKEFLLLRRLYGKDYWRIINYITFKMDCLREQEFTKCKIDISLLNKSLEELNNLYEEKEKILASVMPKRIIYKTLSKPSKLYKKDGSLSSAGEKWFNLLLIERLPESYEGEVSVINKVEEPNPGSTEQLKDFLFSLGWKPIVFKDGSNGKVPQILDDSKRVCKSIRDLYPLCPELETLDQMSLIKHRIGVFKSFRDSLDSNNCVEATANGFTNTMRFMHSKPVANLVKVGKFYGEQIRGLITIPNDDYLFCGSDCSALEDTTKQNYMFKYDPDYVTQMRTPGFDPHIDIAVLSGLMSKEESEEFKRLKKVDNQTEEEHSEYTRLNSIRSKAKTVNFAGIYGAGAPKIAETLKSDLNFAKALHTTYWNRNKAVKQTSEDFIIRIIFKDGTIANYKNKGLLSLKFKEQQEFTEKISSMWLLNPYSKLLYPLRYFKDAFSTGNQGLGVWCFDNYVRQVRKRGIKISLQYHDEIGFTFLKDKYTQEDILKLLKEGIKEVNEKLNLDIPIDVSADFGTNYAQCH